VKDSVDVAGKATNVLIQLGEGYFSNVAR